MVPGQRESQKERTNKQTTTTGFTSYYVRSIYGTIRRRLN